MKTSVIVVSAATAFTISAGGALGVVLASGYTLNWKSVAAGIIVGLITAAKDTRSLLKLPPVNPASSGNSDPQAFTKNQN